ncbi:MAG: hypothetical protein BGO78_14955 [Chloroflexi bacterium 44-23]|nr:MAG: hypothetical protein BGO78_14955 [Chloroflexi bacterium 44-23]
MKNNQFINFSFRARASLLFLFVLLLGSLSSCSGNNTTEENTLDLAPLSVLPMAMQQSPVTVRESYQFAVANSEALKNVPCYCGCNAMGHTSNYDCYIQEIQPSGDIVFDEHALGCSICVDISQDVMKMTRDGKPALEIREFIDLTYAQYGPSNMPPVE